MRPHAPPRLPVVDPARCTGCGRCVAACGPHVLSLETVRWRKRATLHDVPGCTGCSLCERRCPFGAIQMMGPTDGNVTAGPDVGRM
jgi:NAD-dependent dihydropyrimidine dehydrogenase PreA subunit